MPAFEEFWAAYPRKAGKLPASKVWDGLMNAGVAPEAIMAGLRLYAADKPDWQHWCHPTTFLRQQRWSDFDAPIQTGPRMPQDGPRIVEGCIMPMGMPDGALPVRRTMAEVEWILPDGSRAIHPRFPKAESAPAA